MRSRFLLLVPIVALAPLLGAPTGGRGGPIKVISPASDVTSFDFLVEIRVPGGAVFDPDNDVTLNGVPIPVTRMAKRPRFSATLSPGFPLLDANHLEVKATLKSRVVTATRDFAYAPPKARVRQITNPADLIQGPLAHGRVGDWLIENSVARFIVQDVGQRDMQSVGAFGGNLIDLELVANPGNDHFIEIQPMLNVETVVNAQTVEVVNDGQDGTPAMLRTCGPDDLLDFVNPSSAIFDAGIGVPENLDDNDQTVEACNTYTLNPLEPWVRLDTDITNFGTSEVQMLVGDWYNPGGQLEVWDKPQRLGEVTLATPDAIDVFGYDEAEGVDYGYTTLPLSSALPGAGPPSLFNQSGVTVVLHHMNIVLALVGGTPPFFVDPGSSRSFSRYLSVGDGSGANAVTMETTVKGLATGRVEGCVTVGGKPLAGSRVMVVRRTTRGAITRVETQFVTKAGACPNYGGVIAIAGGETWEVTAARRGAPYPGGLTTPTFVLFAPSIGDTSVVDVALPATGRLSAHVENENGTPLPARVSVIGIDPSPSVSSTGPGLIGFGAATLSLFEDPKEFPPFGVVALGYSDAAGDVAFDVEPGSYQLLVSRGTEYSVHSAPLTITAGATTNVSATIARVLDTPGFVSSDFHVHGIRSPDSRVMDAPRVAQFAGEGVENIIMTDHQVHTDLSPAIASLGLGAWVTSTVGEEITTFDYGHFNGYPFTVDTSLPSGGVTDWAKAAPPGQDFPSLGAFNATPGEIFTLATTSPRATPDTTVQVNHINSHFQPMRIDTSVAGPISDDMDDSERAARRLPSIASVGNLFHHFPALELWNGADRGQQSNFLDERIGIWMNHLNKGLRTTMISDTDTHTFGDLESAGARTWTASSTDLVPGIGSGEVANAVDAGRAVGGQGLYVQTRLLADDGSGLFADLTLAGSTDVVTTNGAVQLEIKVQAPIWARFDTIDVYKNAATTPVDAGAPYLFTATPFDTKSEGDCDPTTSGDGDFDITTVNVHPAVLSGERQQLTLTLPYAGLTLDSWFVVVVRGADGVCPPMFPVYPRSIDTSTNTTLAGLLDGNVGESGTMALGVANALYVDVDGVAGFQPPNP